jgi:hypothetical protein
MDCKIILSNSKRVTIKEPKAIDPRDSVDARPKAESVGCFGYMKGERTLTKLPGSRKVNMWNHLAKIARSKVVPASVGATSKCGKCDIPHYLRCPKERECFIENQSSNFS